MASAARCLRGSADGRALDCGTGTPLSRARAASYAARRAGSSRISAACDAARKRSSAAALAASSASGACLSGWYFNAHRRNARRISFREASCVTPSAAYRSTSGSTRKSLCALLPPPWESSRRESSRRLPAPSRARSSAAALAAARCSRVRYRSPVRAALALSSASSSSSLRSA